MRILDYVYFKMRTLLETIGKKDPRSGACVFVSILEFAFLINVHSIVSFLQKDNKLELNAYFF